MHFRARVPFALGSNSSSKLFCPCDFLRPCGETRTASFFGGWASRSPAAEGSYRSLERPARHGNTVKHPRTKRLRNSPHSERDAHPRIGAASGTLALQSTFDL